jgi:hypothetical protein
VKGILFAGMATTATESKNMKTKISRALLVVTVAAIPSIVIHPFGAVKAANSFNPLFSGAQVETPVLTTLRRSCANCHSEQTAVVQLRPTGVVDGGEKCSRWSDHFNMSHWEKYSAEKRIEIISEISVMIRNKPMPLAGYT